MISITYKTAFLFSIFLCIISACSALEVSSSCSSPSRGNTATLFLLCDGGTLSSNGEIKFVLGFFTPKGNYNNNKYVGIWYLDDPETVVWVANRDHPLPENSNGSFGIRDGNLHLLDEKGNSHFSTELEPSKNFSSRTTRLLENGNLVLSDESSGKMLWQSFDNPTDTFLPGMKMSENLKLISWRDRTDPSSGIFRFEQGEMETVNNGYVIMNGMGKYWKSGGGNFTTNKMYDLAAQLLNNPVNKPPNGNLTVSLNPYFNKTRMLMNSRGEIEYFRWDSVKKSWLKIWSEPQTPCSFYNACGKFGNCNEENGLTCECLPGFEPAEPKNWNLSYYSGGCSRKSTLCTKEINYKFLLFKVIKVEHPDYVSHEAESEDMCKEQCLNCQCQAYSYSTYGCYIWTADLADLQLRHDADLLNIPVISIKIANSASGDIVHNQPKGRTHPQNISLSLKVMIFITSAVIVVVLLSCSTGYIYYRRVVAKRRESRKSIKGNKVLGLCGPPRKFSEEDKKNIDVPFFDLETILAATAFFSDANKLGQGGFGLVYKHYLQGMFPRGQEIAVKRLSIHSTQGLEELKNEVVLIAKLQHRNLVRLLGYCIEGEENILLYEYMPNKSLDAFIFDQNLCVLLDWEKRFEIILGIARGLLYLHQDSRLRVIHRDLKASNILLDEDMNPKISDFGLARIVGGRETEANTNRIVGTYGYMSPEYALGGLFSIKSDIFSFGVVVLEIISGKRNTGFYEAQHDLNLLGYAWRLWKEDRSMGMVDQTIVELCNKSEVLKCIIIGLLCVQEDPGDRPTMSNIVFMLGSEFENLPRPKQPAFVARTNQQILSDNELTVSTVKGR